MVKGMIRSKLYRVTLVGCFFFLSIGLGAAPLEVGAPKDARRRLIAVAEGYRGTPYRYGGLQSTGIDCSGLVYMSFYTALHVSVPRTVRELYQWVDPVPRSKLQIGDLVFFNTTGTVSHVGIYVGDNQFIHAASDGPTTGVIYSSLDESYWKNAFVGAGRAIPSAEWLGLLLSLGASSSWGTVGTQGPFRGVAFQAGIEYDLSIFSFTLRPGLEGRFEWDQGLGVVRFPVTLSLGLTDQLQIFAGPTLSFGDATVRENSADRRYTAGGGFWGTVGLLWNPISFRAGDGRLSLFMEGEWQSYVSDRALAPDWSADLAASLRLSAGFLYRWGV